MRSLIATRTRLGADQALGFKQVVRLEDGGGADAARGAGVAHGRQLVAHAHHAVADRLGDLGGQGLVQAHGAAWRRAFICCFAGSPWLGVP
ncbi:hypothetical protein G6F40_015653 [Rhizopus arrhizus]|nr:hypothetical protein G6F40_015653 [Rhizopus arrhizus]KAG1255219.1 hypothetical protein G6F66_014925 [Rhizopus arrhizus]